MPGRLVGIRGTSATDGLGSAGLAGSALQTERCAADLPLLCFALLGSLLSAQPNSVQLGSARPDAWLPQTSGLSA